MDTAIVDFHLTQGEDWTSQLFFTDASDTPIPLSNNLRMDIKDLTGSSVYNLTTTNVPVDFQTEKPSIVVSEDIGLVQLHLKRSVTKGMSPGHYSFDLFAKITDEGAYAGDQVVCLLRGRVVVHKKITGDFE